MSDPGDASPESSGARPADQSWFRLAEIRGCAVVTAGGEIDVHTSPGLVDALRAAGQTSRRIVLDLAEVTFLDSTGLTAMVGTLNRTRSRGGAMSLVGPTGVVGRVLQITELDQVFAIHDTVDDAVEAMDATSASGSSPQP